MRRAVSYVLFSDMLFILLLSISSLFDGTVGQVLYFLSFLVPVILVYFTVKVKGLEYSLPSIRLSKENLLLTLPLVFPLLILVFLISWLTSLVLSLFSEAPITDVSGNLFAVILLHAVFPAVLEELLFRFVPIALISPYGKRSAILLSSVMFSLIHANLFQIPYAFLAGVIFAFADLAFGSVLPSLILHFLNNFISIIWMRGFSNPEFSHIFIGIFVMGGVVSLIFTIALRKRYKIAFEKILSDKSEISFPSEFVFVSFMLILLAIFNLF